VVPSAYLEEVFARHGHRAAVIPNVLDLGRFTYRERDPLRPRLLSTRNLEAHYAVDQTLRAFALVRLSYPEATLTIVGGGSQERRLRHLAAALGGGRVRFAGRVEPARMPPLYDDADLFVNSSVVDNQPLSVIEAFAAGLPLVSTAAGGIPEMVDHGQTGLIVPPGDPAAMARAVASLLERPEQARAMARRARRRAERHTWPGARAAWTAAYAGGAS
jgi:phenylacetate-CoA ligase